jgi:hypothetical protein
MSNRMFQWLYSNLGVYSDDRASRYSKLVLRLFFPNRMRDREEITSLTQKLRFSEHEKRHYERRMAGLNRELIAMQIAGHK